MKKWGIGLAVVVLAGLAVALGVFARVSRQAEPMMREELERWLSIRLNSDVTLDSLDVRLRPILRVEGRNLVLRLKNRPDLPPFITIARISGSGGFTTLRAKRLSEVRLEGLEITVPPGRKADLEDLRRAGAGAPPTSSPPAETGVIPEPPFVIERLVASSARVTVMPRTADRDALEWDIRDLVMEPFSLDAATPFRATIDTPLPRDRAGVTGYRRARSREGSSTCCRSWPSTCLPGTSARCPASTGRSRPTARSSAPWSGWPPPAPCRRRPSVCAARTPAGCP